MFLSSYIIQASIVIGVIVIFVLSVYLNSKVKPPKDVKLPDKCGYCPSKTCVIKLSDVETRKEELREYLDKCEVEDEGSKKK